MQCIAPSCFVHLGKYGDLMIMFPAFKAIYDATTIPPICIVSTTYATIFNGISYAQPWAVDLHWWKGVSAARKLAEAKGYKPIVVKWWDEPNAQAPVALENGKKITLTIHGQKHEVPAAEWDSYQASQWRYAGFTMQQMMDWPLVFDRRNEVREQELCLRHFRTKRPKILYNFNVTGTSPFQTSNQIMPLMAQTGCELIDLSRIRATRIYDLLGLYDRAALLVTSDTATLHLAAASKVPYIAFINNGGAGSIPKGNCISSVRYGDLPRRIPHVHSVLQQFRFDPKGVYA